MVLFFLFHFLMSSRLTKDLQPARAHPVLIFPDRTHGTACLRLELYSGMFQSSSLFLHGHREQCCSNVINQSTRGWVIHARPYSQCSWMKQGIWHLKSPFMICLQPGVFYKTEMATVCWKLMHVLSICHSNSSPLAPPLSSGKMHGGVKWAHENFTAQG